MRVATIEPKRAVNDKQIAELVTELRRQGDTRKDYIIPASGLRVALDDDMVKVAFSLDGPDQAPTLYEPTWVAHQGLYSRLGIARTYYERMGEQAPDLLVHNVNYWTERDNRNFMVRTIDGKVRALMSDRYRTLDSTELFFTAFNEVKDIGAKIVQADLTETNFYMKMLHPEWAQKVEDFKTDVWSRITMRPDGGRGPLYHVLEHLEQDNGRWLVPGIVLRNSDVGQGSLNAELFVFDTICWNGIIHDRTIHQVHLGRKQELGFISQETHDLEDKAMWSTVRDMIRTSFNKDEFLAYCKRLQAAAEQGIAEPTTAVDTVVKNFGFSEDDKDAILNQLLVAGSNTVYGLMTAVTAVGRDKGNYDEGIKFERAGGDIISNPSDFLRTRRRTTTKKAATV